MTRILLDDEKIHALYLKIGDPFIPRPLDVGRNTAKAQLKRVADIYREENPSLYKKYPYFWERLLKEAGGE